MNYYLLQNILLIVSFSSAALAFVLIIKNSFQNEDHKPKIDHPMNKKNPVAKDLLRQVKEAALQMQTNMNQILHAIAAKDIQSMKTATLDFETSYEKTLSNLNQELNKTAVEAIQNTQKTYADKLTGAQNMLDQEISEYKKERMEKIDQEVKEIIDKVYKSVLKTSIPENLQHELIIKSLEEAKKDGIFNL